ncbi:MAG: response regulator transcription factor, partial [Coprobacillaceae bacterium]
KDKLRGFSAGVDDYVVKPFDPSELMARVKAILKRYSINASNIIQIHDVEFDGEKYEIRYQGDTIYLPLKQFELVFELVKNPDQIFSREQLIEKIWGMDYDGFDRTVDVHIKRIRENLGHLPGFRVVTVRGLGYKVEVE